MPSDVVVLYGRPGVGKFTVGRALSEQTGYRLIHNHGVVDLVTALFPFGSSPFVDLREHLWLTIVDAGLSADVAGLILTFVPERTVRDSFLPALRELVQARGAALRLVELRCGAAAHSKRLAAPERTAFGKIRDPDFYRVLEGDGAFDRPVMPAPDCTLAIDDLSPHAAAAVIAEWLTGDRSPTP
jgi:hypothetical protein